jgi:hypothetical protein
MGRTIEVEIDDAGYIHPVESTGRIPAGRGLLTLLPASIEDVHRFSEDALAEDWLRPEEDEAWAHLQPER